MAFLGYETPTRMGADCCSNFVTIFAPLRHIMHMHPSQVAIQCTLSGPNGPKAYLDSDLAGQSFHNSSSWLEQYTFRDIRRPGLSQPHIATRHVFRTILVSSLIVEPQRIFSRLSLAYVPNAYSHSAILDGYPAPTCHSRHASFLVYLWPALQMRFHTQRTSRCDEYPAPTIATRNMMAIKPKVKSQSPIAQWIMDRSERTRALSGLLPLWPSGLNVHALLRALVLGRYRISRGDGGGRGKA